MRECEICHIKKELKQNFRRHGRGFSCICRKCEKNEKIMFELTHLNEKGKVIKNGREPSSN